MKKETKTTLVLTLVSVANKTHCYWCGQKLRECGMCRGSGAFKGQKCNPCKGQGCLCPTHEGDWDE